MARERLGKETPTQATSSLIAAGMRIEGDVHTDGTVRIEGAVNGKIVAGKAVVVTAGGTVEGAINTQDAVISGSVTGEIVAASRLEVKPDARIKGKVDALRMQFDYGATYAGEIAVGESESPATSEPTVADVGDTGEVISGPVGQPELRIDAPEAGAPSRTVPVETGENKATPRVAKRKA